MTGLAWLIAMTSFATVAFLTYGFLSYYQSRRVVRDRFKKVSTPPSALIYRDESSGFKKQFLDWVSSLGKFAMSGKEDASDLRQSLIQAGFRHPKGPAIYFGVRVLAAFLLPVIYLLANVVDGVVTSGNLMVCFLGAGL